MRRYTIAAVVNGLAILALMAYSLDRTSWLFGVFESGRAGASMYGLLAAIVIEVAAVALIVGDATIGSRWAGWGLATILATQGVANFIAGYVRGANEMLRSIGPGEQKSVFAIAAVALALTNFAVPFLIFVLSKLEADIVKQAVAQWTPKPQPAVDTMTVLDAPLPQLAVAPEVAELVDTPVAKTRQPRIPRIVRWRDVERLSFDAIGAKLKITRQAAQKRYDKAKA